MNNLETKVEELDKNSQARHDKLELIMTSFINEANKKYVTKDNVKLAMLVIGMCLTALSSLFAYAKIIFPLLTN